MEIQKLSNNLETISQEIIHYKKIEANATLEIGKRLKHVKENDLAHGEFGKWLKDSVDITWQTADRYIRSYNQFGNYTTSFNLPIGKMFEMLSLPDSIDRLEFVEQEHTVPSTGEMKTVEEMTVREVREVVKETKTNKEAIDKSDKFEQSKSDFVDTNNKSAKSDNFHDNNNNEVDENDEWIKSITKTLQGVIKSLREYYDDGKINIDALLEIGKYNKEQQDIFARMISNTDYFSLDKILSVCHRLVDANIEADYVIQACISVSKLLELNWLIDIDIDKIIDKYVSSINEIKNENEVDSFFMKEYIEWNSELKRKYGSKNNKYSSSKNVSSSIGTKEGSYRLLGVTNNDQVAAKKQYQKLVKLFHPDTAKQIGLEGTEYLFQIIKEAYEQVK